MRILSKMKRILKDKRGEYIEYLIAAPVFFFIVIGGIVGYQLYEAKQVVTSAAWEGAREMATNGSEEEARYKVYQIVSAHLPTGTISSTGVQDNVPDGYITGVLSKSGNEYRLSSLGLVSLKPADEVMRAKLDGLIGKTVAIKAEEVKKPPQDVPSNDQVEGVKGTGQLNYEWVDITNWKDPTPNSDGKKYANNHDEFESIFTPNNFVMPDIMITFYTDKHGHYFVSPTIENLGGGVYKVTATHVTEQKENLRALDISIRNWGSADYIDVKLAPDGNIPIDDQELADIHGWNDKDYSNNYGALQPDGFWRVSKNGPTEVNQEVLMDKFYPFEEGVQIKESFLLRFNTPVLGGKGIHEGSIEWHQWHTGISFYGPKPSYLPVGAYGHYAWRAYGEIYIPENGKYSFAVDSDDASEILIDDNVILSWYGPHGMSRESGGGNFDHNTAVTLTKGWHAFEARMQQWDGGEGLVVAWKKPGDTDFSIIPGSQFRIKEEGNSSREDKIFFDDTRYWQSWTPTSGKLKDFLKEKGFRGLNADQLKTWMVEQISNGTAKNTVVVFAQDIAPDTILENESPQATFRKYLDAGGKIVWVGDIPLYYRGYNNVNIDTWGVQGTKSVLGFEETFVTGSLTEITQEGSSLGIKNRWESVRPLRNGYSPDVILARDANGNISGYLFRYANGGSFIRIHDKVINYENVGYAEDVYQAAINDIDMQYGNITTVRADTTSPTNKTGTISGSGGGAGTTYTFNYTGSVQTFTTPYTGRYKLEVWGAQGGGTYGGQGGYSRGEKTLNAGETLYVYVGGRNGWNGGGSGHGRSDQSGGGGTDIRYGGTSLDQRIIVAGGGGGQGGNNSLGYGGSGGGLTGGDGGSVYTRYGGGGGTQTSGGSGGDNYGSDGYFGVGGSNTTGSNSGGGGGGGGWYGGGAGGNDYSGWDDNDDSGGGGGSGYIGGVENGYTQNGGRTGDGLAKITLLNSFDVNWDTNNTFPTPFTKAETKSVTLRLSNPSNGITWNPTNTSIKVEWRRASDNLLIQAPTYPVSTTVNPGGTLTQTLNIQAPSTTGMYNVVYKLVSGTEAGRIQTFSGIEVRESNFKVEWDNTNTFPSVLRKGETNTVTVKMRNPSDMAWNPSNVRIDVEWRSASNNALVLRSSFPLSATVNAGNAHAQTISFTTPNLQAGDYNVTYNLFNTSLNIGGDKIQTFTGIKIEDQAFHVDWVEENTFPKDWLTNEKKTVRIGFTNTDETDFGGEKKIQIRWMRGNTVVSAQTVNLTKSVPKGITYRADVEVTAPSTPGFYNVEYQIYDSANGKISKERQTFYEINVGMYSTEWRIYDAIERNGNRTYWTGKRFDPLRDVKIFSGDPMRVQVDYHVPMFFPITDLIGHGNWEPMITVSSEAKMRKEAPEF
ncbi:glycine-rich protein [Thermicanus aegyptius]|uniref:glycine-rich protein n=1 Tax=Thermicanus aegyptius TaxID=94009 RepID=UPI0003FA98C7|nr:glycine-rich protein [Thermicanus aegyptius]